MPNGSALDDRPWSPDRSKQHVLQAIQNMATSSASLQARLADALLELATLQTHEIPPHDRSREKFEEIKRRILAFRDDPESCDDEHAESTAEMIVEIYSTIQVHAPGL